MAIEAGRAAEPGAAPRRILVIGGSRFMGLALVWRLLAAGARVTLFNRGGAPDPFGDRVERIRGDRKGEEFVRLLAGKRFDAAVDFLAFDGEDARRALEALAGRVEHYVFIGTGQVYLVREGCPSPAREPDYEGPTIAEPPGAEDREQWRYGMGKRACEDLFASSPEFPSTRIRIPMVNGERDPRRRIESYLWRLLDGGPVLLPDGGAGRTRHVYALDVAAAVAGMLGKEAAFGEAYNLCQDETPTVAELAAALAEILGARPRLVSAASGVIERAGLEPARISPFSTAWMSFLEPEKAKRDLGFRHEPLRAYLKAIVASFLAHPPESPPEGYGTREREIALARELGPEAAVAVG